MICCARCFESLTAPIFIDGAPYGWTCANIVQPGIRKPKVKRLYVVADTYTEEIVNEYKSIFRAKYNGRTYRAYRIRNHFMSSAMQYDGKNIYIDTEKYKSLKSKS